MGVVYSELLGHPTELWTHEGFMAVRRLICAWEDRDALVMELGADYGQKYPYGIMATLAASGGVAEEMCPRVIKVAVEPHPAAILPETGSGEKRATYEKALLTVTYSTMVFSLVRLKKGGKLVLLREELKPAGEFISLDPEKFFWENKQQPIKDIEAPGKMITRLAYTITYYNIVGFGDVWKTFVETCRDYMNHCNNLGVITFTKAFEFRKNEVQYMWTDFTRVLVFDETPTWTIKQRFLIQSSGEKSGYANWNKMWNAESDKFEKVYKADGTQKFIVPEINFDALRVF